PRPPGPLPPRCPPPPRGAAPPSRAGGDASRRRDWKSTTEGAVASLLRGLLAPAPMVMLRSRLQLGEGDLAVAVGVEPAELVGSALLLEDGVVVRELLGRQRAVPVGLRLCECLRLHGLALGLPVALGERRGAREHQGGREPSCDRFHQRFSFPSRIPGFAGSQLRLTSF